jgi:hypothetical protein
MRVIDCHGTGLARGIAHGESARDLIGPALARWETATLSALPGKTSIADYAATFLDRTGFLSRVRTQLPDLAEEVRGIALGAGVAPDLIAAYNLMDEQWWYDLGQAPKAEPGCSLIGVAGAGYSVLAQNMDLPDDMDGGQVVLRLSGPDLPETLALSAAGMIGLTGVNRAGVAICVNTLLMLRHQTQGLPVAFVMRAALAQRSAAQAVAVLRDLSHASGQHYAVADASGVTGLECAAGGAVTSSTGQNVLLHTNHPLHSADLDADVLALLAGRGRIANSELRLDCLQGRVTAATTAAEVEALLSDQSLPMCMVAGEGSHSQTFGSVVFRLGAQTEARFRLGLPGRAAWHSLGFAA